MVGCADSPYTAPVHNSDSGKHESFKHFKWKHCQGSNGHFAISVIDSWAAYLDVWHHSFF